MINNRFIDQIISDSFFQNKLIIFKLGLIKFNQYVCKLKINIEYNISVESEKILELFYV
jgi:hypothetical protein